MPAINIVPAPGIGELFAADGPIPRGFQSTPPGTRLSLVSSMYPEYTQSVGSVYLSVYPPTGPFKGVAFFHDTDQHDPPVRRVGYYFRDASAREQVRAEALRTFGAEAVLSKVLGRELEWSNVAGYRVRITEETYEIARAG